MVQVPDFPPISLLLVDDQIIIRQGLRSLLESQTDFRVVGEADNGQTAIEQTHLLRPDLVLMDIRMPGVDGVAATRAICEAGLSSKILVLTTFDHDEYVWQAMRWGAKGYLLKDTHPEILAQAIRHVHQGHTQMGPGLFEKLLQGSLAPAPALPPIELPPGWSELTAREREVLELIAKGSSNREIAHALYISEKTVKNHVTSILGRLGLRDRTQAALLARSLLP
ncbi:MAG: response regulator transcription factor [Cyanobacteriota bacterium]|nr:response regulator transcription factor [Cyanobacteriota bacterium]